MACCNIPIASSLSRTVCITLGTKPQTRLQVFAIGFPIGSLGVAVYEPANLQVTSLKQYVSVVKKRYLIRYMPINHQVPYIVSLQCQVYNLLPIASYKSRLFTFRILEICANQIFHVAFSSWTDVRAPPYVVCIVITSSDELQFIHTRAINSFL